MSILNVVTKKCLVGNGNHCYASGFFQECTDVCRGQLSSGAAWRQAVATAVAWRMAGRTVLSRDSAQRKIEFSKVRYIILYDIISHFGSCGVNFRKPMISLTAIFSPPCAQMSVLRLSFQHDGPSLDILSLGCHCLYSIHIISHRFGVGSYGKGVHVKSNTMVCSLEHLKSEDFEPQSNVSGADNNKANMSK